MSASQQLRRTLVVGGTLCLGVLLYQRLDRPPTVAPATGLPPTAQGAGHLAATFGEAGVGIRGRGSWRRARRRAV